MPELPLQLLMVPWGIVFVVAATGSLPWRLLIPQFWAVLVVSCATAFYPSDWRVAMLIGLSPLLGWLVPQPYNYTGNGHSRRG